MGFDYLNNENLYKEWESRKTFDDIINDENFIDEAERENPISLETVNGTLKDFFNSKEYKQLTFEQQAIIKGCIGELGNKFAEFAATLNHTVITVEDVYAFFNKYKDYFDHAETESIDEALKALGEDEYSEEELRLMRIMYISEKGH